MLAPMRPRPIMPSSIGVSLYATRSYLPRQTCDDVAMATFDTEPGTAHPLGITVYPEGVNFSLFSQMATDVELLLFEHPTALEPSQIIGFDPFRNKTFHFWHVFV